MAYEYDDLPTPLPEYANTVFTTSMTHQLHCLVSPRHPLPSPLLFLAILTLRPRQYTIIEAHSALSAGEPERLGEESGFHLSHCFDYLRQSIMCCGDVALEGKQTTFPEGTDGSDGWDAKHVCRDYTQVKRYLTRKRADNREWI